MKSFLTLMVFLFTDSPGFCQKVEILTVDRLNEEIKQRRDTTYIFNFWATWCSPCIKEMPHFEKLQQTGSRSLLERLYRMLVPSTPQQIKTVINGSFIYQNYILCTPVIHHSDQFL